MLLKRVKPGGQRFVAANGTEKVLHFPGRLEEEKQLAHVLQLRPGMRYGPWQENHIAFPEREFLIAALEQVAAFGNIKHLVLVWVDVHRRTAFFIAVVLENMQIVRPLTHDLMKNFMRACHVDLQEVIISDLQEGIFYSKLICHTDNDIIEIDSRTSDALALAVRFGCPIYIYEDVLRKAEKKIEDSPTRSSRPEPEEPVKQSASSGTTELSRMSLAELHQLLNEVLEQEDYIRAITIRDEINKRK